MEAEPSREIREIKNFLEREGMGMQTNIPRRRNIALIENTIYVHFLPRGIEQAAAALQASVHANAVMQYARTTQRSVERTFWACLHRISQTVKVQVVDGN